MLKSMNTSLPVILSTFPIEIFSRSEKRILQTFNLLFEINLNKRAQFSTKTGVILYIFRIFFPSISNSRNRFGDIQRFNQGHLTLSP